MRWPRVFDLLSWTFLAVLLVGTGYAGWKMTSLLPALRQVQFEFFPVLQTGDVQQFKQYYISIYENWPSIRAAHREDAAKLIGLAIAFALVCCVLLLSFSRPKGEIWQPSERLNNAKRRAGFHGDLYVRTDGGTEAHYFRGRIYVSTEQVQDFARFRDPHAEDRLVFVITHEMAHGRSTDNLFWSVGRSIILFLVAIAAILLFQVYFYAAIELIPDEVSRKLPDIVAKVFSAIAAAIASTMTGFGSLLFFAGVQAAREYFADSRAICRAGQKGFPYLPTTGAGRAGADPDPLLRKFSLRMSPAERAAHCCPGGGFTRLWALVVGGLTLWCTARFLLIVSEDSRNLVPLVLAFDVACLALLVLMVFAIQSRHTPDGGDVQLAAVLVALVAVNIGPVLLIEGFTSRFGLPSLFSDGTLLLLAGAPVACIVAGLAALALGRRLVPPDRRGTDQLRQTGLGARLAFPGLLIGAAISFLLSSAILFISLASVVNLLQETVPTLFLALSAGQIPTSGQLLSVVLIVFLSSFLTVTSRNLFHATVTTRRLEWIVVAVLGFFAFYCGMSMNVALHEAGRSTRVLPDILVSTLEVMLRLDIELVISSFLLAAILTVIHGALLNARGRILPAHLR